MASETTGRAVQRKVVMISIDGLRPEFYSDSKFNAPTLKWLAARGARASGMEATFPTVTYPNHTTLVTGVPTAKHGVLSNTRFDWKAGPLAAWYWEFDHIKVPTLWEILKATGKKTAAIRWPVTVGAQMSWNVPEIFPTAPWYEGSQWDLTVRLTRPELMNELLGKGGLKAFKDNTEADVWGAGATAYLMRKYHPDLTLLHLQETDHQQHAHGRDAKEVLEAVTWVDERVKEVVAAADASTCVLIVGDHGFKDYKANININRLFLDQGWITLDTSVAGKVKDWTVIAQKAGAQAAIYSKDRALTPKILQHLQAHAHEGYRIITGKELAALGAYPNAVAAISALDGFSIGGGVSDPLVTALDSVRGQHGHHPADPQMRTGFIASGCGIQPKSLGLIRNVDVAPTVLKLLGVNPIKGQMSGRVLPLF